MEEVKRSRVKPLLRGVVHVAAAFAAVPATIFLIARAHPGTATTLAAVYGASLIAMHGSSGLYHTPMWSLAARRRLRRLDHSMIYVLIAGSYAPFAYVLDPVPRWIVLATVIGGAVLGFVKAHAWELAPRWLTTGAYVVLGWCVLPFAPQLYERLGPELFWMLLGGGAMYTAGAVVYAVRWPNPWPRVFGYHEVDHLFMVGGAVTHYCAIWRLLTG